MPSQGFYILPEEQFKYLLTHEGKHAQRYEHFFSLLTIKFEKLDLESPHLSGVLKLIGSVIRDSDTIGSLQDEKLAVILHYADSPVPIVKRVVKKIQTQFPHLNIKARGACFPTDTTAVEDLTCLD